VWASLSLQKHSRALARPGKRGPEATSAEWRNAPEARAYGKHAVVNNSVDLARMQAHTLVRAESCGPHGPGCHCWYGEYNYLFLMLTRTARCTGCRVCRVTTFTQVS
jgi:hypothetical protein